jgi:hypothetical protein
VGWNSGASGRALSHGGTRSPAAPGGGGGGGGGDDGIAVGAVRGGCRGGSTGTLGGRAKERFLVWFGGLRVEEERKAKGSVLCCRRGWSSDPTRVVRRCVVCGPVTTQGTVFHLRLFVDLRLQPCRSLCGPSGRGGSTCSLGGAQDTGKN